MPPRAILSPPIAATIPSVSSPSDRCAALLAQLIGFRTENPGGNESALCMHLAVALRERGADEVEMVEVQRQNGLGGYVFARFGHPITLLNAHIDTVPAQPGWSRNPFEAAVDETRVVGLGAADTKGAIAAILTALESAQCRDVGILFSGDEERGTSCMRAFLAERESGNHCASEIRRAVVCEPTDHCAGLRHRGFHSYVASFEGKGGHSSLADRLPKPIVTLARLAVELDALGARYLDTGPEEMKGLCLNVASIEGGLAFNMVPDRARLVFSLRPPPGFDRAALAQSIADAIDRADPAITLEQPLDLAPFECTDEEGFRALFAARVSRYVSLDLWTEAALLAGAGIDTIVVGPGSAAQAHAADEWVARADLDWAVALYRAVIEAGPP